MFYEGVRFIQIFEQDSSRSKGTLFTNKNLENLCNKNFLLLQWAYKCESFDYETIIWTLFMKWTYQKKKLVLHLSLTKT
jgi:hypothetical protein